MSSQADLAGEFAFDQGIHYGNPTAEMAAIVTELLEA